MDCSHPRALACVGNNGFYFTDFYKQLTGMYGTDLLNSGRLTMGFSDVEIHTDYLAAKALSEGRVINLDDTLQALDKLKDRQEKFSDSLDAMARLYEKREADRTKYEQQRDRMDDRVRNLEGYNSNGNNAIEHCVADAVDDYMCCKLGYTLEDRISGKKLFNTHGQEIGELDGLLCYQHEQTKKKVAIMVEAKTNMSHAEFRKVHKTVRHWKDLIQKTNEPSNQSWPLKYVNQYNLFKALINYDHLVAVGSPIMPEDIGKEAVKMGYLIVSHDSYEIENGPQWSTEHVL
jgi:hypothetical protein